MNQVSGQQQRTDRKEEAGRNSTFNGNSMSSFEIVSNLSVQAG